VPIKAASNGKLNVTPLSGCLQTRDILTSKVWQTDLHHKSFAYLLSLDGSLTDYPNCTLDQVINAYGNPNSSTLVAGSLKQPDELLLFYDNGAHKSAPKTNSDTSAPATVLPITPDQLPSTSCPVPTIMSIVAHQDDDLLFMNPDLINNINAGDCIRTVFVTAGDAGEGQFYWLSRERGSEAAYTFMTKSSSLWIQRIVELSSHEFITIANPKGNTKVSLIFMHLPDGDLNGQGFAYSHYESLAKLDDGSISLLHSVDSQSYYSSDDLSGALTTLMHIYQPTEIVTQANYISAQYPDHSDHMAVGRYVKTAYSRYETEQYGGQVIIPIKFYIGYPIHGFPANVSGANLDEKEAAFLDYSKFDGGVCQTVQQCQATPTYGSYLTRQYQNAY
jgi:LmbE family N-acetylglucosaminyl deacetylase